MLAAAAGVVSVAATYMLVKGKSAGSTSSLTYDNVLIGDVGGTNVRLQLIRLYHNDLNKKDELK